MKNVTIGIAVLGFCSFTGLICVLSFKSGLTSLELTRDQSTKTRSSRRAVFQPSNSPLNQRGFCVRSLTDSEGRYRRYVVFVPYDYAPERPAPAILSFNGYGENGSDGILQVNFGLGLAVWEMKRSFPFLVIFPQCDQNGKWDANGTETQRAMSVLDDVCSDYKVARVFLTGVSAGGTGAWAVAAQHPERFAGLIPLCGVPESETVIFPIVKAKLPVWDYYLDGDKPELVAANRRAFQALLQRGASPHVTEIHDVGHNCWDHAYRDVGLYSWMLSQDVQERFDASGFSSVSLNPFVAAQWQLVGGARIESLPDNVSRLQGAGESNPTLVHSVAEDYAAMHLEFRLSQSTPWIELTFVGINNTEPTVIRIANPMLATSFISQGAVKRATSAPSTWGSFRQSQWNDLRVRRSKRGVTVTMNGWPLMASDIETNSPVSARMEIRLPAGPSSADLRNIRSKLGGFTE